MSKIIIRRGVFETNSSSTHSYAIIGSGEMINPDGIRPGSFQFYSEESWSGYYPSYIEKALYFLQSMVFFSAQSFEGIFSPKEEVSIEEIHEAIRQDPNYIALEEVIYEYCGQKLSFSTNFGDLTETVEVEGIGDFMYENVLTANYEALPSPIVCSPSIGYESYKEALTNFIFNRKYIVYCMHDG